MRAARGLKQLRSSSDKRQALPQGGSNATAGSVHDSWNSMPKSSAEDSAQVVGMLRTSPWDTHQRTITVQGCAEQQSCCIGRKRALRAIAY